MENDVTNLGVQAAIAWFLVREIVAIFRAWQARRWKKDDITGEQQHGEIVESRKKIEQLYEKMLESQRVGLEQQKLQFEQQQYTLAIIDRNTEVLEKELPLLVASNRDLTGQVARMEKRIQ